MWISWLWGLAWLGLLEGWNVFFMAGERVGGGVEMPFTPRLRVEVTAFRYDVWGPMVGRGVLRSYAEVWGEEGPRKVLDYRFPHGGAMGVVGRCPSPWGERFPGHLRWKAGLEFRSAGVFRGRVGGEVVERDEAFPIWGPYGLVGFEAPLGRSRRFWWFGDVGLFFYNWRWFVPVSFVEFDDAMWRIDRTPVVQFGVQWVIIAPE